MDRLRAWDKPKPAATPTAAPAPAVAGKRQSLREIAYTQAGMVAPLELAASLGLHPGATMGECVVARTLRNAAGPDGASKELLTLLQEDKVLEEKRDYKFTVVYHDKLQEPRLRALGMDILLENPSPELWDYLKTHLQRQLPVVAKEVQKEIDALTPEQKREYRKKLAAMGGSTTIAATIN